MQDTHDVRLVCLSMWRTGFASCVASDPAIRIGVCEPRSPASRMGGALLMGFAILAAQFPRMAVAAPGATQVASMGGVGGPTLLAGICAFAVIVLAAALVVFLLRRRFARAWRERGGQFRWENALSR